VATNGRRGKYVGAKSILSRLSISKLFFIKTEFEEKKDDF